MSSYGNHLVAQTINGEPIGNFTATKNLNQVLQSGNSAANQDITNVKDLGATNVTVTTALKSTASLNVIDNDTNEMINSSWSTNHVLLIKNLPTTDPLVAGQVFTASGVLTVSTGGGGGA
jgi:hypothetical protein